MNRKKILTSALVAVMLSAPLSTKAYAELRWLPMENVSSPVNAAPAASSVDPLVLNELLQKIGNTKDQDSVLTALLKQQNDMSALLVSIAQQQQATAQANFLLSFLGMPPAQQQALLSILSLSPDKLKTAIGNGKTPTLPHNPAPAVNIPPATTEAPEAPAPLVRIENTAEAVLERFRQRNDPPKPAAALTSQKRKDKYIEKPAVLPPVPVNTETAPEAPTSPVVNNFTYTFSVYCKPGVLSQIRLQPGEEIQYIGGGDLSNWHIEKNAGTTDGVKQWNLYIKPLMSGISTNIIITTDQNTYQLLAKTETSRSVNRMANVAENLNYGYKVESMADMGDWTIYDDGLRTYIKMPASMGRSKPELYVLDAKKSLIQTSYKQIKDVLIIDRLFDEALVSLGKKTVSFRRGI